MYTKAYGINECQIKFASDDATGEFEGYASVFNSNDAVNDTIAPGAFKNSLTNLRTPSMFINHDHSGIPVGDWKALSEDDYGLKAVGQIDLNHKEGPSLYSAMKRGAMDGLSIGFTMNSGDFEAKDEGGRLIKDMKLREVSVVTFPCEDSARIGDVKAEDFIFTDLKTLERYLRDACGFSKSAATAFVSRAVRVIRGEPETEASKSQADKLLINYLKDAFK